MKRAGLTSHVLWGGLAVLVMVSGCGGNTATSPSATATHIPSTGPNGPDETWILSGRVLDEDGSPVPNATVVVGTYGCCSATPVHTDSSGAYQAVLTVVKVGPADPFYYAFTDVTITAPGFEETDTDAARTAETTTQDFRLFRPLTAPGTDLHLHLDSNNSLCGIEGEFPCRPVHVSVPSGETVIVEVISDDPAQPAWLIAGKDSYPLTGQTRLSLAASSVVYALGSNVSFVIRATVQ